MWPFAFRYPASRPQDVGVLAAQNGNVDESQYYIIVRGQCSFLQHQPIPLTVFSGGMAGTVLAARLTKSPKNSVLVLERGPVADSRENDVSQEMPRKRPACLAYAG